MSGSGVIFHGVGCDLPGYQVSSTAIYFADIFRFNDSATTIRHELRARSVRLPALYRSSLTVSRMSPLRFG
ncbi:hypothetical protein T12_8220 [Trichinella patagoniensis]|uniref:Uncharacterized protein n=1 Tax=Trichinella patagoniensis TaxID=990121 RepID=A0A0V0ZKV0_9BILA|nr:hypothetical protein T12_8220 [Trichinella patagoniensis]